MSARAPLAPDDPRHGTLNAYSNYGCRCDPCRTAKSVSAAAYRNANPDKIREANKRREVPDPLEEGDRRHGTYYGYIKFACRCSPCSDAAKLYRTKRYEDNRERILSEKREWRRANPELAREGDARRRDRRDPRLVAEEQRAWRQRNSDHVRRSMAAWRQSPAGRASTKASWSIRRARKQQLNCGCVTPVTLTAVWHLTAGRCAYCAASGEHVDHVIPLVLGGWHCVSNLKPACARCNLSKQARPLTVFLDAMRASGVTVLPTATTAGLPCAAASARLAARALTAAA